MDRQKVKSGLGLMFWGNIVALFAVIPILGVIAALVGGIMELIAIVNLKAQSEKYNNAFWFTIIGIVLGLLPVEMDYGEQRCQFFMALQHWQPTTFAQQQRNVAHGILQGSRLLPQRMQLVCNCIWLFHWRSVL